MSLSDANVPAALVIAGAAFLAGALGFRVFLVPDGAAEGPQRGWFSGLAAVVGVALLAAGIYFYARNPSPGPAEGSPPATVITPLTAATPTAASTSAQATVGPNCEMVTVKAELFTRNSPPLSVGARVAITGPDAHQGERDEMWIFVEEGTAWYPWPAAIDRANGTFYVAGITLGREDKTEDANVGVRYAHVALLDPTTSAALSKDINSNYRALSGPPSGSTDLFVIPLNRVCTPQ
ncbi:hypothetical protein [Luedemannella helvata]|uniref:SH3 domain-containing protein n=1 Tax=Luedemannella helvata TaxID=349315 RepID=A0ABP4VX49_9ACTN